jgi:predicted ATP-binding protein involved in virulence
VYIDKITLTNIRGFKHLDFSLARPDGSYAGWTVFTGDNGGGKSTLLKATTLAFKFPRSTHMSLLSENPNHYLRYGETNGAIHLDLINTTDTVINQVEIQKRGFLVTESAHSICNVFDKIGREIVHNTASYSAWLPYANPFLAAYGSFRRLSGSSIEALKDMSNPSTASVVTLFQESSSLAEVDQWMRQLKYKELEGKESETEQLKILLTIFQNDFLPKGGITIDRVDSDGLWLKDKNGLQLSWGDMSDGYRSALALLADILRHMIEAYGVEDLTGMDADGKLFIKRSGVVLIDEIDAHLHPSWQRDIGFWLKKHFPAIQFLVTTHSPIICQAADPNGIFVLPSPASDDEPRAMTEAEYNEIVASKSDAILLTPAFGLANTRSDLAVANRSEWSRLRIKERAGAVLTEAEKARFEALTNFVNADAAS